MPDGPDEPEAPTITWRMVVVPDLLEARIITGDDGDGDDGLYAGYVARTSRGDKWHGYVGLQHESVGMGTRGAVQAAVEQVVREAWAAQQETAQEGNER